jgi:hypothetical protein
MMEPKTLIAKVVGEIMKVVFFGLLTTVILGAMLGFFLFYWIK